MEERVPTVGALGEDDLKMRGEIEKLWRAHPLYTHSATGILLNMDKIGQRLNSGNARIDGSLMYVVV